MSFLTPLYLLGVLAVTLPVVFHMIRRTPRGQQEFSSVMFLEPSPPRITHRSTIEHWLLLLLRAAAVCLLAVAFARPFLRLQDGRTVVGGEFREIVVLLDTSASMRREGVWQEAIDRVHQVIADVEPMDRVELLAFDRRPRVLMDVEQWTSMLPTQRVETVDRLLDELTPTWAATDLGLALIEAAERLDDEQQAEGLGLSRTIVVVSDLQQGCRIESLQSYQWPKQMAVRFKTVGSDVSPNNAGLHAVVRAADMVSTNDVRVRVTNAAGARREQFTLNWVSETSSATDASVLSVSVAPGKSRVVSVPKSEELRGVGQLILKGDDHAFDNTCHVGNSKRRHVNVLLVSDDESDDPEGMRYYLERALAETSERTVTIHADQEAIETLTDQAVDLMVITKLPTPERLEQLRDRVTKGDTALVVPASAAEFGVLFALLQLNLSETGDAPKDAAADDYVMLSDIDFTHPLFAALDQPRFSDFTKVRFWRHRQVNAELLPDLRVLARFDDNDIAAGEVTLGEGRVVFFTSGWQPEDSQLALSTKFVPMLNGLLDDAAGLVTLRSVFVVGDAVDLSELLQPQDVAVGVITPSEEEIAITEETPIFTDTDQPGRYRVLLSESENEQSPDFVVNLDPSESLTTPLSVETVRAVGLPMDSESNSSSKATGIQRQLHNSELEQQQKLWRWIIIAAILVLFVETLVAFRVARASRHG